jgi:hypothetical protein
MRCLDGGDAGSILATCIVGKLPRSSKLHVTHRHQLQQRSSRIFWERRPVAAFLQKRLVMWTRKIKPKQTRKLQHRRRPQSTAAAAVGARAEPALPGVVAAGAAAAIAQVGHIACLISDCVISVCSAVQCILSWQSFVLMHEYTRHIRSVKVISLTGYLAFLK